MTADPIITIFARLVKDWPMLQYGPAHQRRVIYSYIRGLAQPNGVYNDTFDTLLMLANCYVKETNYVPGDV